MTLNHINLIVEDITKSVNLFTTYFDFQLDQIKGDNVVAVLHGKGGFTLVLLKSKESAEVFPRAFHIGFMQDSREEVNQIFSRLKADNVISDSEPKEIRDSYGFYFTFDKIMIEIGCYS